MRINLLMAFRVMLLDMFKLGRLAKRRHIPIQIPEPVMQRRIARADISDVTLEMLDVDRVEAYDGRVEAYVCFGDLSAKVVWFGVGREMGFGAIEGRE